MLLEDLDLNNLAEQKSGQGSVLFVLGERNACDGYWYSPAAVAAIVAEALANDAAGRLAYEIMCSRERAR
jgi:hypothetical protein